jgi:hypothetical protein
MYASPSAKVRGTPKYGKENFQNSGHFKMTISSLFIKKSVLSALYSVVQTYFWT